MSTEPIPPSSTISSIDAPATVDQPSPVADRCMPDGTTLLAIMPCDYVPGVCTFYQMGVAEGVWLWSETLEACTPPSVSEGGPTVEVGMPPLPMHQPTLPETGLSSVLIIGAAAVLGLGLLAKFVTRKPNKENR